MPRSPCPVALALALSLVALTACGATPTIQPTAEPTPVPPVSPSPVPTPTATATPAAPTPTPVLSQLTPAEPAPTAATPTTPSPAPLPPTVTPPPNPVADLDPGWYLYANANQVQDVAYHAGLLWAATQGGVVAWDPVLAKSTRYTTLNGLPHNVANAVVACPVPEWRVVVGTGGGLALYDPAAKRWEQLRAGDSPLLDDEIRALACVPDSRTLLIGYGSRGLHIFEAGSGAWRHLTKAQGLGDDGVNAIGVVGNMGQIWAAGSNGGLSVITNRGVTVYGEENSALPDGAIAALLADAAGHVWMGPASDARLIHFHDGNWTTYDQANLPGLPARGGIHGLAFAPNGMLWVGLGSKDGAVCGFDRLEESCAELYAGEPGMGGRLTSLVVDPQGHLYYGSAGDGVSTFDGDRWRRLYREGDRLARNEILGIGQDHAGRIWVGTRGAGAQRLDPGDPGAAWDDFAAALPHPTVYAFYPDPWGGLWVGHGAGASFYDGRSWTHYGQDQGILPGVRAIAVDGQGRAWFGTDAGISVWDGTSFETLAEAQGLPDSPVRALLADGDAVWVGTQGGGVVRFLHGEYVVLDRESSELPSDAVSALALDQNGSLLVGAGPELVILDLSGEVTALFETAGSAGEITSIGVGDDGSLWLGTRGDGVYYLDGLDWHHLTTAEGLPTNRFLEGAVRIDSLGTVWLGGAEGGLARYVP